MGGRVADRGGIRRAVDADPGSREAHPARSERIAEARWDRLLARRPGRVRRKPPRITGLDHDLPAAERGRVARLAGGDAEPTDVAHALVEVEMVRAAADHDHRPEVLARDCGPETVDREPERRATVRAQRSE